MGGGFCCCVSLSCATGEGTGTSFIWGVSSSCRCVVFVVLGKSHTSISEDSSDDTRITSFPHVGWGLDDFSLYLAVLACLTSSSKSGSVSSVK